MSNTTNYGWNIPDNTDLVKDGALAIRTLGSAIDTSMNTALGTKKAGMVLLNTTSFSGVSSTSFSNLLSSTYEYYRLVINVVSSASAANMNLRFRENTTDKAASYYGGGYSVQFNGTLSAFNLQNNSAQLQLSLINASANGITLDIFRPDATQGQIFGNAYGRNQDAWIAFGGQNASMSNFTGLTLLPSTGTITGNATLYGYNK
jgi:hypothetical protein